jgi:hypothetical protein
VFESTSKLAHKLQAARNVRPNKAVTRAISRQKKKKLVLKFNLRELRVRLVKLSDSQKEKLTQTHSGDKSASSLASQDVDQQQAASSDGKHSFLQHKYISAGVDDLNYNVIFLLIYPHSDLMY